MRKSKARRLKRWYIRKFNLDDLAEYYIIANVSIIYAKTEGIAEIRGLNLRKRILKWLLIKTCFKIVR